MPLLTTHSIPVLMYHKVGLPVRTRADRFLNVSTESFRRQMRTMLRLQYRPVCFAEVVRHVVAGIPLPHRCFCVTFDDGYECTATQAAPVLHDLNIPATVFMVSSSFGTENSWDRLTGKSIHPIFSVETARELQAHGWEMGGHTVSHPHLDQLDESEALREIRQGREELAQLLGGLPETFCYPFGHLNAQTPSLVEKAGYSGACTTRSGLARIGQNPFVIPRVKVSYSDGVAGLLYRLLVRPHLPDARNRRRSHDITLPPGATSL